MWKIQLIIETVDEDEVDRIAEAVALAACPVRHEHLTAAATRSTQREAHQ